MANRSPHPATHLASTKENLLVKKTPLLGASYQDRYAEAAVLLAEEDITAFEDDAFSTENDPYAVTLEVVTERFEFFHSAWTGLYSGLYGMQRKHQVPKPSEECFGNWIIDDVQTLRKFRWALLTNFWTTNMKQYEKAWFDLGDLMFRNEDECHFKLVLEDLSAYCSQVEPQTLNETSEAH